MSGFTAERECVTPKRKKMVATGTEIPVALLLSGRAEVAAFKMNQGWAGRAQFKELQKREVITFGINLEHINVTEPVLFHQAFRGQGRDSEFLHSGLSASHVSFKTTAVKGGKCGGRDIVAAAFPGSVKN